MKNNNPAEKLLLEISSLPTAAGREDAVIARVAQWVSARSARLGMAGDRHGNLVITRKGFKAAASKKAPLFITAHMDHPAFVVLSAGRTLELEFRGGVQNPYFKGSAVEVIIPGRAPAVAKITALDPAAKPFKRAKAALARPSDAAHIKPGFIARWKFPPAGISNGLAHTHACDDLACVAAALSAYDAISRDPALGHVALLFTRAEEVGFVGAIGAARGGTIPKGSRLVCLECSRSFPHDSPIGAGPIVRVGDRMSVFTPELTNSVSAVAEGYAKEKSAFRFQRKLMPGGVCEASAFSAYGIHSTCVCLPLGNYHNMAGVEAVEAGARSARPGREFVSVADYHGMIELLGAIARRLDAPGHSRLASMEKIWAERGPLLDGAK